MATVNLLVLLTICLLNSHCSRHGLSRRRGEQNESPMGDGGSEEVIRGIVLLNPKSAIETVLWDYSLR